MKTGFRNALKSSNLLQISSYLLIFAFLINIIYIPCYLYIRNINRNNVIANHMHQLENGLKTLDSSITALSTLPFTISSNTDFNTTYYSRADFNDKTLNNLRQTVNSCLLPFDFICDNGLVVGDALFFTRSRIYYDLTPLTHHSFFNWDRDTYLSELSGSICVLPATHFFTIEGDYEAITIAQRFRQNNNSYFFALYPLDKLFALFADSNVLNSGHLAIYSGDTLLAEEGYLHTDSCTLLTASSKSQLNIKVELQLPNSYIQEDLAGFTRLVRIFIIAIITTSLMWGMLFSYILWKPYRGIHNALHKIRHIDHQLSAKGFTDSLVDGINQLGEQLADYEHILTFQKERLQIHNFEKAIYRGLYNEEDKKRFNAAFPDFPDNWQLLQCQYTSEVNDISSDSIQPILIHNLQMHWNNLLFFPQSPNTLLVLIPLKGESSVIDKIHELMENLMQQYPISISARISNIYNDPSSLMDAAHELEYEALYASPNPKTSFISMLQLQTIYSSLQSGDEKAAIKSLNSCTTSLFSCYEHFSAKYTYRMLDYMLLRLRLENDCISNVTSPSFNEHNVYKLFNEDFPQCFTQIAAKINQQQKKLHTKLDQDIIDFIQSNLTDPQLGITMVTDHFSISAPTLQKRMQARCQMTVSAYIESSRMKMANQLLRNTDTAIQEIAKAVGYSTVNSFYKAYKRLYNESPLDYRTHYNSRD